jgi:hypothetical protein
MGHRGRSRPRRRRLRFLAAVAVVGGAVALLPNFDAAHVVNGAINREPDWRVGDNEAASRFGGRNDLESGRDDQNSPSRQVGDAQVGVPRKASGRLTVVPAAVQVPARGRVLRYVVEVEDGLPYNRQDFADMIRTVLNDQRSWGRGGTMSFQQVAGGPADFTIALASPALTDLYCLESGNDTEGQVSCFARRRNTVMINALRWADGAPAYGGNLTGYRTYLINHEVGHRLGHHHVTCPGPGRLAPIMVQQTKGVGACKPNPWPHP